MTDSPDAALAAAAARIAALQAELAGANGTVASAQAAAAAAEGGRAAAERALAEAQGALQTASDTHAAAIGVVKQQLADARQHAAKSESDRAALAAKFDALYGPVEDGIARGPAPYVTTKDGKQHATLAAARLHLVATEGGLTTAQAQALVARADTMIPLVERAKGAS